MEVLAYTHSYESYEEAVGIDCDLDLRELNLNWFKIPNTAWLGLLGCAVWLGSLSVTAPVFAALESGIKVKTPSGGCLTARKGPSDTSAAVVCVSNGAVLKPVVATNGNWLQLSSGNWVYGPYTTSTLVDKSSEGGGGSPILESGIKVKTPNGGCLKALTGPGTGQVVACVRSGSALKPVVAQQRGWLQLTSGNWVYGPYTTSKLFDESSEGGGGSPTLESGIKVKTPNGGCLKALPGPGTGQAVTCVSSGSVLKPVVAKNGNWLQLSSGNWVYGPYTTSKFF
ncbi:hypothetical protein [Moorena sp. SIO3B2]|uniref:hypothetical protein n=1 Tax=Moorena sp. SIO3B2 TaxID=2607827 RepID=UPI0013C79374|nr:hypothetical protein [Moorena sp. SIO3B2]NEP31886.1 hypothetical protein [Moorena sp. SIO3B2]